MSGNNKEGKKFTFKSQDPIAIQFEDSISSAVEPLNKAISLISM